MIKNATFSITNRCNSCCKICNIWKTADFSDELSAEQIKKLLSKPFFQKLDTLSITGGEPFLRNDLEEIIRFIGEHLPVVRRIFLNTNASLVNKVLEISELCTNLFSETVLSISVDGRKQIHNELRGVNNYDNVISLLEKASQIKKLKISLSMTLSETNCTFEDLHHVYLLAEKYNTMFNFRFADNSATYYKNSDLPLSVSPAKKKTAAEFIKENCQNNEFLRILEEYIETNKIPLLIDENGINHCLAGKEFVFIHPNGTISPCLYSTQTIDISDLEPTDIKLGKNEKCPCCTDCAIYPILEYLKNKNERSNYVK